MSGMNDGNKYIFKVTAVIIVVIINLIALIAVFITVGSELKDLKKDIESGKISKEEKGSIQISNDDRKASNSSIESEQEEFVDVMDLDPGNLFRIAITDKNVRKSIILMIFALILLTGAIFILVKLK